MASARQDGLGFLDRLVIFLAWLASCGVVFVIGYYVGKYAVPPGVGVAPGPIEVPIAGAPAEERRPATFYEGLGRQGEAPDPGVRIAAPATPRTVTTGPPTAGRPTTIVTVPQPTTTRPAPTPSTVVTTSTIPAQPTTTRASDAAPAPRRGRGWTVYVSPTRDRFEAERQRAALRAAGYSAAVVPMQRDGDMWYRVRAGVYGDEAAAERVRRDLRDRGIGHAFVQSE